MNKIVLNRLWNSFPDHVKYKNLAALYTSLGGAAEKNINAPGFGPNGNACARRLSAAFNLGVTPINYGYC